MTGAAFRKLALSFPGTSARPHFDRTAFRTTRKTFATLGADGRDVNVILDPDAQEGLVAEHPGAIQPVPGGWGRMGWTTVLLPKVDAALMKRILEDAFALAAPKPKKTKPAPRAKR